MVGLVAHCDIRVLCIVDYFELGVVLGIADGGVGEGVFEIDGDAVAGVKGVNWILMGLNATIGDFGVLDNNRMSGGHNWQAKNEIFREFHFGRSRIS